MPTTTTPAWECGHVEEAPRCTVCKPRTVGGGTAVAFSTMSWPAIGARLNALEHELRYGPQPNVAAASVISAYRALILKPRKERNYVIRVLRAFVTPDQETD